MSRNRASVLIMLLGGLLVPVSTYAQLTPPAGSAGAGNSPISGVPFGPANPSSLSDPSGIGNASRIPPVGTNTPPPPPLLYVPPTSSPPRVATPYVGDSQRIVEGADRGDSKPRPARRRGRAPVSTFTGICRGC